MAILYVYSNTNSDLTTFAGGNRQMVVTGATSASVSVSVASNATVTFGFFTNANVPTATTSSGTYTVKINVTTGNNQITLTPTIARINSAGVVQTSATTTGQVATAGTKTFTITADLGTFTAGDRFRVSFAAANGQAMTNSFTYTVGSSTTDTTNTPFNGPQSLTGSNTVGVVNSSNGVVLIRGSTSNTVDTNSVSSGTVFNNNNNATSSNTVSVTTTTSATNPIIANNSNTVSVTTTTSATNPIRANNSNTVSVNTSTLGSILVTSVGSNIIDFENRSTSVSEFAYYDYFINMPLNSDGYFINLPALADNSYSYFVNLRK